MTLSCTGFAFIVIEMTCVEVRTPPPRVVCPPVRTWTREFQGRVAAEMRAAPGSALSELAVEYIGDRAVARACAQLRKK